MRHDHRLKMMGELVISCSTEHDVTLQRRTVVWQLHRLTVGGDLLRSCSAVQPVMSLSRGLAAIADAPEYSHATQYGWVDSVKFHWEISVLPLRFSLSGASFSSFSGGPAKNATLKSGCFSLLPRTCQSGPTVSAEVCWTCRDLGHWPAEGATDAAGVWAHAEPNAPHTRSATAKVF